MRNWAGNYEYTAARVHAPRTVPEVQEVVAQSNRLKALGTRHSFNEIADSSDDQISLEHLNRVLEIDESRRNVTVQGGVTYGQLCRELHGRGYALHNLASLPHISIAGACATATHGSGDRNRILASAISAVQIVTADGNVLELSRDHPDFHRVVVGLGGFGVVTRITLDLSPTYQIRQDVFENLPLAAALDHFDELMSSAYSVSLFTTWQSERVNQVWVKRRTSDGDALRFDPTLHGATAATKHLHPLAHLSPVNCTEQLGVPGAWHERLPHFRMDFTPSAGDELQSEYLVPREHAVDALRAIDQLRERIAPLLQVSEIRSIAADEFPMSPCYRQSCVGIHFTWMPDWTNVRDALPAIEASLAPFGARPHWGKL